MARIKKVRKASEMGRATTLWLRVGTIQRASRAAARAGESLSAYVERTLVKEIESQDAARADQDSAAA